MTSNQIAYVKQREEQRHNVQMEYETNRSNLAKEAENVRANNLNYNASIYASQASMYNAKLNYDANIYAAQMSSSASRYASELNYKSNMYKTNMEDFNRDQDRAEAARHNRVVEATESAKAGTGRVGAVSNVLNAAAGVAKLALAFMA